MKQIIVVSWIANIFVLLILVGQCRTSIASFQNNSLKPLTGIQTIEELVKSENNDSIDYILNFHRKSALLENSWTNYLKFLSSLSNAYQSVRTMDKAMFYSGQALHLYDSLKLNNSVLDCRIKLVHGTNLYKVSKLMESESFLNQSLELAESMHNDSLMVQALKTLGNVQVRQRKFTLAIDFYKRSLDLENSRSNSSKITASSLYQNIGISFASLEQYDSALIYLRKCLLLKEQHLNKDDPKLAVGYLNFSRFLQISGEINEALDVINSAEQIYLSYYGQNSPVLAPLYFNKGAILVTLSDYLEALHYHELSLELYKKEYKSDHSIFSKLYSNFGHIYFLLDRIPESIDFCERSLKGEVLPEEKVRVYNLLGKAYLELNLNKQAEKYFIQSSSMAEDELGEWHSQTANSYIHYGLFCHQARQFKKALAYFSKAEAIYQYLYGVKSKKLSDTYTFIADTYTEWGKYSEAFSYYQNAIISFINDFNKEDIYSNPSIDEIEDDLSFFFTLSGKASAFYQYFSLNSDDIRDLEKTLEIAELSITLFERIKSTLGGEQTKLLVTKSAYDVYNLAVKASTELYEITGNKSYLDLSFTYSEKGKAAILLSTLKELEALETGDLPEEIKAREKRLKSDIAQYQNVIYEETQKSIIDSNKVARLRNRLFHVKLQYDTLVASLEANYPDYYNLKYNIDVISIANAQNKLEKNSALIEYKLIDSVLYTYIIKKDTATVIRTLVGACFTDEVNTYLTYMNSIPDVDSVRSRSYAFGKLGYTLYTKLQLHNPLLENTPNLIVITDDILGYLSFEALISDMPNPENSTYSKLNYLIQNYTFSYGYSGTLLFNDYNKTSGGNKVLAFAPAYNNVEVHEIENEALTIRGRKELLIDLEHTQAEVSAVVEIFNGSTFINSDATENNFKAHSSDYNILHFAMHTLINDEDPMASKLVFTMTNDSTDDGFLNTYEIYNLDLNAELAVLSACKSGTGKYNKGEGIMSLARGFLYAGVPGIVMTLWSIEDKSGFEIITSFYENLKEGQRKDIALRNAKLTYLNNANQFFAHPYFWAAHVQIGDSSPIISTSGKNFIYYGIAGFVLIIPVSIVLRRRKRKAI